LSKGRGNDKGREFYPRAGGDPDTRKIL